MKSAKRMKFSIHPLFIAVGVFAFFMGSGVFFLLYTLSVFLHELGHMIVAERLGYKMREIKLLPYGAILNGESDEFLSADEITIALAGPLTNFLMCAICVMLWWISPSIYIFTIDFCIASLVAGVFNLLPIFPLDGGRVLLGILSANRERKSAVRIVRTITQIFSILLFLVFVSSIFISFNISIGIMAVLIFASSISESKNAIYQRVTQSFDRSKQFRRGIQKKTIVLSGEVEVIKLYRALSKNHISEFIIVNKRGEEMQRFAEADVYSIFEKNDYKTKIKDVRF